MRLLLPVTLDPVYLLKGYATGCAAMFAGAALYINVAEHPARMTLDVVSARKQWVESFNRAKYLQVCITYMYYDIVIICNTAEPR